LKQPAACLLKNDTSHVITMQRCNICPAICCVPLIIKCQLLQAVATGAVGCTAHHWSCLVKSDPASSSYLQDPAAQSGNKRVNDIPIPVPAAVQPNMLGTDIDAVAATACISCSRLLSLTASTKPQFATGPQKCVVFGPAQQVTLVQHGLSTMSKVLRVCCRSTHSLLTCWTV
jgi:hypothetical protein